MPYPEIMIHGMRQELAQLGIEETKTTEAVDAAVKNTDGTLMVGRVGSEVNQQAGYDAAKQTKGR